MIEFLFCRVAHYFVESRLFVATRANCVFREANNRASTHRHSSNYLTSHVHELVGLRRNPRSDDAFHLIENLGLEVNTAKSRHTPMSDSRTPRFPCQQKEHDPNFTSEQSNSYQGPQQSGFSPLGWETHTLYSSKPSSSCLFTDNCYCQKQSYPIWRNTRINLNPELRRNRRGGKLISMPGMAG